MDIVERLRKPVDDIFFGEVVEPIKWEAADEIERLREALREIIETNHMDYVLMKTIARDALQQKESE